MFNIKKFIDPLRAVKIRDASVQRVWTRDELVKFQQTQLQSLVRHAMANSAFYRELYKDIVVDENMAITDLPAINKTMMMENYDQVVTDPRLKLADLQGFIPQVKFGDNYLDQFRVFTTSGSTGLQGVFVFNRDEWIKAVSTGLRVSYAAGFGKPRFPKRWRFCCIGAGSPLHVSASFFHSAKFVLFKQINLPVTTPHDEIVTTLNNFQPDLLATYSSLASLLAIEQLEGRLDIHPTAVTCSAELCTPEMQQNIKGAWGVLPFNNYGMTESGCNLATECSYHSGLHIFEDYFIVEAVDEDNNQVADGEPGAKMLFTNLYNYTQPIIRYEISDVIALSAEPCQCGHPFKRIVNIEGRADEILYLHDKDGNEIPVHPHNLRSPIAKITDIKQFQIIQETDGFYVTLALRKDVASAEEVTAKLKDKFTNKLASLGAVCPAIHIKFVDEIKRDQKKMGKLRLIKSNIKRNSH